jgi:hypothetical protein
MASAPPLIGLKTASSSIWKSNPKAFSENAFAFSSFLRWQ